MKNITLKGISAPLFTPFHESGSVNTEEYARLTHYVSSCGIGGVFVGGTSGEFVNLRARERISLLKAAKEGVCDGAMLMFNVTSMNEAELLLLMEAAKKEGADAVSVTAPYYHKYDEAALHLYFHRISEVADGMPVYLYNMSGMTNNPISHQLFQRIAGDCPNIRGIKDSSMDFMTLLKYLAFVDHPGLEVITGNDAQVLPTLLAGGAGGIIATACVYPELSQSIWSYYVSGDLERASKAQDLVLKIRELFRSVMPVMAHKEALNLQGFHMGPARFPFRSLTVEEKNRLAVGLNRLGMV